MAAYRSRASWFGWAGPAGGVMSAPVGGVNVTLTFLKPLRTAPQPAAAQFTATVAGVSRGIVSVTAAGNVLTFVLAAGNLTGGQTVAITYVAGATANQRLAYTDGTEVASGNVAINAA